MKALGLKISTFMLVLGAMLTALLGFSMPTAVSAASSTDVKDSYWMQIGEGDYRVTENKAGQTSGYDNYILGQPVTLTATANEGYQILGWRIDGLPAGWIDGNNPLIIKDTLSHSFTFEEDGQIKEVSFTATNLSNTDVYNTSSLSLTKAFKDLSIEPIFGYVYYNLNLTSMLEYLDLSDALEYNHLLKYEKYEPLIVGENNIVEVNEDASDEFLAVYNGQGEIEELYYVENLYKEYGEIEGETSVEGTGYYVYQNGVKVDPLKGAYKLGQQISISELMFTTLKEDKLIQGTGATLRTNKETRSLTKRSGNEALTENSITFIENEKHISSGYAFNVTILDANYDSADSQWMDNTVSFEFQQVYKVDLKFYYNNSSDVPEDIYEKLLTVTNVENYVSKEGETYYVKARSNNANNKVFTVTASDYIHTDERTNNQYGYYKVTKVNSEDKKSGISIKSTFNFEAIQPETIDIYYEDYQYEINFKFAVLQNGRVAEMSGDYNVKDTIFTAKGVDNILEYKALDNNDEVLELNYGYSFKGFAPNRSTPIADIVDNIKVTIDSEKPAGVTYLMVYEKIEYTIQIANYNQIKLQNTEGDDVLPNPQVEVRATNNSKSSANVTNPEFGIKLKIGDIANFRITSMSSGFKLNGFYADEELQNILTGNNLNLNADYIRDYADNENNIITIYLLEEYETYTLTYYLMKTPTGEKDAEQNAIKEFMANIYAAKRASSYGSGQNIIVKVESDEGSNNEATDDSYVVGQDIDNDDRITIKVEGLYKYDKVDLFAEAIDPDADGSEKAYRFVMFTVDGVTALENGLDETASPVYKYTAIVESNVAIKAVFSAAETALKIVINNKANGIIIDNIKLDKNISEGVAETLTLIDGYYAITNGVYTLDLSTALKTGYKIQAIELKKSAGGNLANGDFVEQDGKYILTLGAEDYELILNIDLEEYVVNVYESEDGIEFANDPKVIKVTVEDRTLSFDKPLGYYVASVTIGDERKQNSALEERNDIQASNKYAFTFAENELEAFVGEYGDNVDMYVVYAIHTYNITIKNSIENSKGTTRDKAVTWPSFTIVYTDENGDDVTITSGLYDYIADQRTVTLRGVPYNTPFTIYVDGLNSLNFGVDINGWEDHLGLGLNSEMYSVDGNYNVEVNGVTLNQELNFEFKYIEYALSVRVEESTDWGVANVKVNGRDSDYITFLDKLAVDAQAYVDGGYVFNRFVYNTVETFVFTSEKWNTMKGDLYIRSNGIYIKNSDEKYDNNKTYYVKVEQELIPESVTKFEISEFNPSTIFVDANGFALDVYFKLREVTIENISISNIELVGFKELHIPVSEFASYTVTAIKEGQEDKILKSEDVVNVTYSIVIDIQINNNAKNGELNEYFNLVNGVYLNTYREDGYVIQDLGNGKYRLAFNMSDVMNKVEMASDILKINYYYIVELRELTVTTNVFENSRTDAISKFNENVELEINYGEFGEGSATSDNLGHLTDVSHHYLTKTTVSYNIKGIYRDYIRIYTVKAYDINTGEEYIDLSQAGITVEEGKDGITKVFVRYLKNIKLEFVVTPLIKLDGTVLAKEKVTKTVTFKPDQNGNGTVHGFAGSIQAIEEVKNAMTIEYFNQDGAKINEPYNAGTYTVKLSFATATENLLWLNVIDVQCPIEYVIERKNINITYDTGKVKTQTKTYDQKSTYAVEKMLDCLIFTDGDGKFKLTYDQIKANMEKGVGSFTLNSTTYRAFISYLSKGVEIETADANETGYLNITIAGLELKDSSFNNNFNLQTSQLTISECIKIEKRVINVGGIVVNDKVYDGTSLATLSSDSAPQLYGLCSGDEVAINKDKLLLQFVDYRAGADKQVTIDVMSALEGKHTGNYIIKPVAVTGKIIYPFEKKLEISNIGWVHVKNEVGLTDPTKANLIPLDAELSVKVIHPDTADYAEIYAGISKFLSRTNVFSVGFRMYFQTEDGKISNLSKELVVSVPSVENLTNVLCLDGTLAAKVEYQTAEDGMITLNLADFEGELGDIILIEKRALLPLWAIILIVVVGVAGIGGGITAYVLVRKKKAKQYSVNDKI